MSRGRRGRKKKERVRIVGRKKRRRTEKSGGEGHLALM